MTLWALCLRVPGVGAERGVPRLVRRPHWEWPAHGAEVTRPEGYHWPVAPDLCFCTYNRVALTQQAFESQQTPATKGSPNAKGNHWREGPGEEQGVWGPGSHAGSASDELGGPRGTLLLWLSASSGIRSIFPKGDGQESGHVPCDAGTCRGTVVVFVAVHLLECIKIHSHSSCPSISISVERHPVSCPETGRSVQGTLNEEVCGRPCASGSARLQGPQWWVSHGGTSRQDQSQG